MTLEFDPEVADVLAQLGGTSAFQPPRDDVEGRRAFWEPILAASSAAQPFPDDVERSDRYHWINDRAGVPLPPRLQQFPDPPAGHPAQPVRA